MDRSTLDDVSLDFLPDPNALNLRQLYHFHAVATEGSFAAAAKKLGVTQPSVSEQIRNLERYLGTSLFERRPDGVRPTADGRRVFEHTTGMFRSVRRLLQEVAPGRMQSRLVLEVGLCPTISRSFATQRMLSLFHMDDVLPRVRLGRYETLLHALLSGELDLVISENAPSRADEEKIGVREIAASPLVFLASPKLARDVPEVPGGLGGLPFAGYTRDSRYRREIDRCFEEAGVEPTWIAEVDDAVLSMAIAAGGLAVVAVPRAVATEWLQLGSVVELGPVGSARSSVYAHFRQTDASAVVRRAIETLSE